MGRFVKIMVAAGLLLACFSFVAVDTAEAGGYGYGHGHYAPTYHTSYYAPAYNCHTPVYAPTYVVPQYRTIYTGYGYGGCHW